MNWLIRMFGARLARRIEEGSAAWVAVGAAVGVVFCFTLVYALHRAEQIGKEWGFFAVGLCCIGGIAGALLGSLKSPSAPSPPPWGSAVDRHTVVRVTNLNRALGPVLIFFIVLGLFLTFAVVTWNSGKLASEWGFLVGFGVFLIITAVVACRQVFWVDFGADVAVRRGLTTTRHAPAQVRQWGFEVSRGRLVRQAPDLPCPFIVDFHDGLRLELPVAASKSAVLVQVMDAMDRADPPEVTAK